MTSSVNLHIIMFDRNNNSRAEHSLVCVVFSFRVSVVPVNVSCTRTEFQIQISQQALPQLDRESVYLGNPSCSAQMTATSYKILARFVNCETAGQVKHRAGDFTCITKRTKHFFLQSEIMLKCDFSFFFDFIPQCC